MELLILGNQNGVAFDGGSSDDRIGKLQSILRPQSHDSIDQRPLGSVETHHIHRVGELLENAAVVGTELGKGEKLDLGEDGNPHPLRPLQSLMQSLAAAQQADDGVGI